MRAPTLAATCSIHLSNHLWGEKDATLGCLRQMLVPKGRYISKRAAHLEQYLVQRGEVEAVALPHPPWLAALIRVGRHEMVVNQINLLGSLQYKPDVKAFRVASRRFAPECPLIAQYQGEAVPVGHDGYGVALTLQQPEVEEALEEILRFGKVVYDQVHMVEPHRFLLGLGDPTRPKERRRARQTLTFGQALIPARVVGGPDANVTDVTPEGSGATGLTEPVMPFRLLNRTARDVAWSSAAPGPRLVPVSSTTANQYLATADPSGANTVHESV